MDDRSTGPKAPEIQLTEREWLIRRTGTRVFIALWVIRGVFFVIVPLQTNDVMRVPYPVYAMLFGALGGLTSLGFRIRKMSMSELRLHGTSMAYLLLVPSIGASVAGVAYALLLLDQSPVDFDPGPGSGVLPYMWSHGHTIKDDAVAVLVTYAVGASERAMNRVKMLGNNQVPGQDAPPPQQQGGP